MKILFPIGTLYPSQQGGPSNTVYWMAKALTAQNVFVTLIATLAGSEGKVKPNTWLSTNYGYVIYWAERLPQLPLRLIFTAYRQVSKHDVVHLNSLFYPPSFLLAAAAVWQKKAVLWSCRGNLEEAALQYSRWKKRPILWFIRRFLTGQRVTFHATSPAEAAQTRNMFGPLSQVIEIPNFLELPDLLPQSSNSEKPFILYMGRLHAIKALDNLLDALSLSKHFVATSYVIKIAGDTDNLYTRQLKRQVETLGLQNHVEFLGRVEGIEKQQLLADAYFLVLPSHSENFGNVVIESLAQGTPVIASKGTPWSMLETGKAGFWADNAPDTLARAIDKALGLSPEEYREYRDNALALARQKFDIRENVEVWIEAYQQAISGGTTQATTTATTLSN